MDHSKLADVVGIDNLYTESDAAEKYGQDWTRFYSPRPSAVVFASDADQLVRLVRFANEHGLSLVPSGRRWI